MDKEKVIDGIKERLYSTCELRPSEVLVLKEYIEELESKVKQSDQTEWDKICEKIQEYCIHHVNGWTWEDDYLAVRKDGVFALIPYFKFTDTELEVGEVIESYLGRK